MHLGHARTFWTAQERARLAGGTLVLRNEDLDQARCRPEYGEAMVEDLRWFGLDWQEGPDRGGPHAPYCQSQRLDRYEEAFKRLRELNVIYPCTCSRQDVARAVTAPHAGEDEPIYPGTCREKASSVPFGAERVNWRFRVPNGEVILFQDGRLGAQSFTAGADFGDFVVWRHDGIPSYQLAVVVDDAAMQITEVVRGADLLRSTARQVLLYRALGWRVPAFYHCPLMTDEHGARLAKRHEALSLRSVRGSGRTPEQIRACWS
jgi:glutamyl-tRNA synthetase